VRLTSAWAIYGHVADYPSEPACPRAGATRTTSADWFIFPSVFQKTVKTGKNREKRSINR